MFVTQGACTNTLVVAFFNGSKAHIFPVTEL